MCIVDGSKQRGLCAPAAIALRRAVQSTDAESSDGVRDAPAGEHIALVPDRRRRRAGNSWSATVPVSFHPLVQALPLALRTDPLDRPTARTGLP